MVKTQNEVSIVKSLPNPASFGKQRLGISVLPPAPSVLVVEKNAKSGEVHVYMTDFQIKFKENAYLRNVFTEDTLNKWEGQMASKTTFKDFLLGTINHNYRHWRFGKDQLDELHKRIRPLPKDFDLQPYIDQILAEEKAWDEADHTVLDLWAKNPLFSKSNVFLHQNAPLDNSYDAFFNRMAVAVTNKRLDQSTKTVSKKVPLAKTEDERNKALLAGGTLLGGTAPYLYKSPFFIKNSVIDLKASFRIKEAKDILSWGFSAETAQMAEYELPLLAGLSGWREITGQPVLGAFLSSESLMAHSAFSTMHRTGGQSQQSLSQKITKEELERNIRERLGKATRRLQYFQTTGFFPKPVVEETEAQELLRLRKIEAWSRAQTHLATKGTIDAIRFLSPRGYDLDFLKSMQTRPVTEQLVFYISLQKRKKREQLEEYFEQEYFTEFLKLPKIGAKLRYRSKDFEIRSVDIRSNTGGHRKYWAHCVGGLGRSEEIIVPTEEMQPLKIGWYIRRSDGGWQNAADIARSPPATVVAETSIALLASVFLKWFKNFLGYAKGNIIKTTTKRMNVNIPKGLAPEVLANFPKDVRVDIPKGTITQVAYDWAAWGTTTLSAYGAVRSATIYESFVSSCIDTAEPYPLANVIDMSLPMGARSYSNFYTDALLTSDTVAQNIKRLAIAAGETVGDVFSGTRAALSTAISWGSDVVKNLFMGVVIVIGLGIVYKIAT